MADLPAYTQYIIFGFTALGAGLGGYFKGRHGKKNGDGSIPHAKNGFMTLEEMEGRCKDQQAICTQLLRSEFKIIKTEIRARLDQGDKTFRALRKEIRSIRELWEGDHGRVDRKNNRSDLEPD